MARRGPIASPNAPLPLCPQAPASPQRMPSTRAAPAPSTTRAAPAAPARPEPRQDDGLVACPICSRRFLPDRVAKHKEICSKSTNKKRKVFDPVVARVKGTEAEKYVRRAKNAPEPKVGLQLCLQPCCSTTVASGNWSWLFALVPWRPTVILRLAGIEGKQLAAQA